MADNPIKYSDLIVPDNSIKQAIEQLKELNNALKESLATLRTEAEKTGKSISSMSGATEQGRKAISNASSDADRIARLEERLSKAYSDNAKEIALLQAKLRDKNNLTKAEIQLMNSAEGSYNQLSAKYNLMKQRLNAMSKAEREGTDQGRKLEQEAKRIYEEMDRLQRATGKYALNVGNYAQSFRKAFAELRQGKNVMNNLGNMFSSGIGAGAQGFTNGVMTIGANVSSGMFGAMAIFNTAMDTIKKGIDTIVNFEKENSKLSAILGETSEGMKELANDAKRLGAETRYTASEVTQLQIELAKLGFTKNQILDMTEGILKFALATGSELSEASALAGASLRMFNANADETNRYVSAMAVSTTRSALSFSYLQTALPIVGGAAKSMNFTIEDTLAILGQLANAGLDASSAATATRNIILNLADANSKLSRTLGHPVKNAEELADALKELSDKGIDLATSLKITDKRSVVAFNNLIHSADGIKELRTQVTGVEGELNKMADTMSNNVAGSLAKLSSAWEGLILRFEGSAGSLKTSIDNLTSFVNWLSKAIGLVNEAEALSKRLNKDKGDGSKTEIDRQIDTLGGSSNRDIVNREIEKSYERKMEKVKKRIGYWNRKKTDARVEGNASAFVDASENAKKAITELQALDINYKEYKKRASKLVSKIEENPVTSGGGVTPPLTDKELKAQEAQREKAKREAEQAYKENLQQERAYEDSKLSLLEDGYEKERQKIQYQYDRQIEDLQHKLQTEEKLNAQGKSAITNEIVTLQQKQTQELSKLQDKYSIKDLQFKKEELNAEISLVNGTQEQINKKLELLEVERQLAILQNKQKPAGERKSEESINKGFSAKKNSLLSSYELAQFDLIQKLSQSEFDLLQSTEEEKTRYKLKAEKERWKKILELNSKFGNSLSDIEIQTIQNSIAKIDAELSKPKKYRDIYEMVGLKLNDDQKNAIEESVSYITSQLSEILDSYVKIAETEYENAQKKTESAKSLLQTQLDARSNGYASDVKTAQKEVALAEKEEAEKLKIKEKYQKAQEDLETAQQAISLITASANIWQSMSAIPIVGPALAIASIATMWTSFAISKVKARQATQSQKYREGGYEFLDGGSHQSGNDVSLGKTSDGRDRKAEGGETLAIFNKNATRKYRNTIPSIVDAINHGLFEQKFGRAFSSDGVSISPVFSTNTKNLERDVSAIRRQGEQSVTFTGNIKIIRNHNLTRIVHT